MGSNKLGMQNKKLTRTTPVIPRVFGRRLKIFGPSSCEMDWIFNLMKLSDFISFSLSFFLPLLHAFEKCLLNRNLLFKMNIFVCFSLAEIFAFIRVVHDVRQLPKVLDVNVSDRRLWGVAALETSFAHGAIGFVMLGRLLREFVVVKVGLRRTL